MEHWLEQEIDQWTHHVDNLSHHGATSHFECVTELTSIQYVYMTVNLFICVYDSKPIYMCI